MMSFYDWISAIFVGFGFTAWAVGGKYYRVHPITLGVMSTSIMALTVTVLSASRFHEINSSFSSLKSFAIMLFLCVINGIAFYIYTGRVADKSINTGIYIFIICVLMMIEAIFLDWRVNGNTLSTKQIIGVILAIAGICII